MTPKSVGGYPFLLTSTSPDRALIRSRREVLLFGLALGFLFLAATVLALAPAARNDSWSELGSRWGHFLLLPVWLACVWWVRRVAGDELPERDPYLLPIGYLLAGWGTLLIWRLLPEFGLRQTGWLVVGTAVLIAVMRGPANLEWLRRYRFLWLAGGLFLTALTFLFGTNPSGGEPRLWLGCCGVYFQPSEPLRLLLIAYLAAYIAEHVAPSAQYRTSIFRLLGPLVVVWGLSTLLVFVQRDLGTGSLFVGLLAVMLYVATRRKLVLVVSAGLVVLGGGLGALAFDVVAARVETWLNPWADPLGAGYQLIRSLTAVARGGVLGRGTGLGAPMTVPASHTDFIFSTVSEEWGLVGALAMIGAVAVLVNRGLRAAGSSRNSFHVLLAAGLATGLGLQSIVIIGGVLRVFPLTGVTLPFVSYGGSSLVTSFAALALLLVTSSSPPGHNRYRNSLVHVHSGLIVAWLVLAGATIWWGVIRSPALLTESGQVDRPIMARSTHVVAQGAEP